MLTNWIKRSDNKILLLVLLLVSLKFISFFAYGEKLLRLFEPWLILSILFLFMYKYPKTSLVLKGFILLAVVGDLSGLFDVKIKGIEIATMAYCLGYLCLIYESILRIKKVKINLLIGAYLVFVFCVNAYFIYVLYDIFKLASLNNLELTFIVIRMVSLFLFALFSFTLYLSSETRYSILLLLMSISLIFSDVIYLINEYYLYFWIFDFTSKFLYLITFYCLYLYVSGYYNSKEKVELKEAFT